MVIFSGAIFISGAIFKGVICKGVAGHGVPRISTRSGLPSNSRHSSRARGDCPKLRLNRFSIASVSMSGVPTPMHGHHAACEIVIAAGFKPGVFHHA